MNFDLALLSLVVSELNLFLQRMKAKLIIMFDLIFPMIRQFADSGNMAET